MLVQNEELLKSMWSFPSKLMGSHLADQAGLILEPEKRFLTDRSGRFGRFGHFGRSDCSGHFGHFDFSGRSQC